MIFALLLTCFTFNLNSDYYKYNPQKYLLMMRYKLSKVKVMNKKKMFPVIYYPFLFGCKWSWLRCYLAYIFIANTVYIVIFKLYFQTVVNILRFLKNLSPGGNIPQTGLWWPFPFTDKANEIIPSATSSGELTGLRSLVSVCIKTGSVFFLSQGLHNFLALAQVLRNVLQ